MYIHETRTKDERAYLQAMTKLIAFVVPKPQEIEHNQVEEVWEITFNVVDKSFEALVQCKQD
jgi:hypothetical protein